jgi:hypothetical protein
MPQPLVEGGVLPATLWIPEINVTAVPAATFTAQVAEGRVRLTVQVENGPGASANVYRSRSEEFSTRALLTPEPLTLAGSRLEYEDRDVLPGIRYHYWVELREAGGLVVWNGPLSVTTPARISVTLARPPSPNPVVRHASLEYTIGADAAGSGLADVSLTIHDLEGRTVRTLKQGREGVGSHRAVWDATDDRGARVPGGIYHLLLRAGGIRKSVAVSVVP